MDDRHPGVGVGDDVLEDRAAIGGIDRDGHRAEAVDTEPGLERHRTVGEPDQHRLAARDRQVGKPLGQRERVAESCLVGPSGAIVENGEEVATTFHGVACEHAR